MILQYSLALKNRNHSRGVFMYFYLIHWKIFMNYIINHRIFLVLNPRNLVGVVNCTFFPKPNGKRISNLKIQNFSKTLLRNLNFRHMVIKKKNSFSCFLQTTCTKKKPGYQITHEQSS